MKRRRSDVCSVLESLKAIAEAQRLAGNLLVDLANVVAASEQRHARFRFGVINSLARIQTTVAMIHGAQIAETHMSRSAREERAKEHAQSAEEFIATESRALGEAMARLISNEDQAPAPSRGKRQPWSNWEI